MLIIAERFTTDTPPGATLTLPFVTRQKRRFRTRLDSGEEAAVVLPRGTELRDGDLLRANNGLVIRVVAAPEAVSTIAAPNGPTLARACYHLGNRHVPLQIGDHWLRYRADHVLDQLTIELGLTPRHELAAFQPEAGAYAHGH